MVDDCLRLLRKERELRLEEMELDPELDAERCKEIRSELGKLYAERTILDNYSGKIRKVGERFLLMLGLGIPIAIGSNCVYSNELIHDQFNSQVERPVVQKAKSLDKNLQFVHLAQKDIIFSTYELPFEQERFQEDLDVIKEVDHRKWDTLNTLENKLLAEQVKLKETEEFKAYKAEDRSLKQNANYSLLGGFSLISGAFIYLFSGRLDLSRRRKKEIKSLEK